MLLQSSLLMAQVDFELGLESCVFFEEGKNGQEQFHGSASVEMEYSRSINDGNDIFTFVPFYRWDEQDSRRTHGDIREFSWVHVGNEWETRVGVRKVFWGVTESSHLVDIINQTDMLETIDGEKKLGQAMVNVSFEKEWGTLDLFVLPGFRERQYRGKNGRFNFLGGAGATIDGNDALYESSEKDSHIDYAVRYAHYIDDFEFGISHFYGTNREASLVAQISPSPIGAPVTTIVPFYSLINQTGLDVQYIYDGWIGKLEAIYRSGENTDKCVIDPVFSGAPLPVECLGDASKDAFFAATTGFEYTQVGIFDSAVDLGWVGEYLFDERRSDATVNFENDVFIATRWTANDADDSVLLAGVIVDLDSGEQAMSVEGSQRIAQGWKLEIEARIFAGNNKSPLADEDFTRIGLTYFF
jgi:hypothetical protein